MCPLPQRIIDEAGFHLKDLNMSEGDLKTAMTTLPLVLKDAAVYLKGQCLGVGRAIAAILAVKVAGHWEGAAEFSVDEIIDLVEQPPHAHVPKECLIKRLRKARALFEDLEAGDMDLDGVDPLLVLVTVDMVRYG